jgi:soluble cytochrome b562
MNLLSKSLRQCSIGAALLAALVSAGWAATSEKTPPKRAKPPVWTSDVLDLFFEDVREHLVGERPKSAVATAAIAQGDVANPSPATKVSPGEFKWSQLVDGDTLVDEVKRIATGLREPLANQAKFKAGGYKQCRADFSQLAVLFAVIAEHDGDVRWKESAPALRDAFSRAGLNCKTATEQTFSEATQRKADLDDLIRGEHAGAANAAKLEKWSALAERPLLMKRMEQLSLEQVAPALGNAKEFAKRAKEVRQEAELLAVLADVIKREEYEYWDDEGFQELATELRAAATDITRAAAEGNYEAARTAAGRADQACSQCHKGWRG